MLFLWENNVNTDVNGLRPYFDPEIRYPGIRDPGKRRLRVSIFEHERHRRRTFKKILLKILINVFVSNNRTFRIKKTILLLIGFYNYMN